MNDHDYKSLTDVKNLIFTKNKIVINNLYNLWVK